MVLSKMELTERVLITGANGFVGKQVLARLSLPDSPKKVRVALRVFKKPVHGLDAVEVGEVSGGTDWKTALNDVSVVVHTAARAHIMSDEVADPLAATNPMRLAIVELSLIVRLIQSLLRYAFNASLKRL